MLTATNTVQRPKQYFRVSIIGHWEFETGERNFLCYITSTPNLFFKLLPSFHYRYKECKKSTSLHPIVGNLHCASYYLYNVRAWFITFLKQNKNAILRNWRQYSEKLINMCFIHFLHCLFIRWVFLAKIMMAYCSNINNVSWKQQQWLMKMAAMVGKTISVVAKNDSNTWRKW